MKLVPFCFAFFFTFP
ncbi:pheA operon leader peptide PheL [Klebsiella pneumoniae]|nr:pheA operon leader peptide PheL [Klebsiella pneumoniae]MEC5511131.1 pheA operon leader peptide PheL [Klebsiella pneumoniae]MEC5600570.1 pheA operon leader peptide PheL [Klebsiella pneumoniae]